MSQTLLRNSLTATLAIASLGIVVPVQAAMSATDSGLEKNVPATEILHHHEALVANTAVGTRGSAPNRSTASGSASKVGGFQLPTEEQRHEAIATIYAHEMNNRPAATVYVRNIPTFTFLGTANTTTTAPAQADAIVASGDALDIADPAVRAALLAAQINQYHQQGGSAEDITVRWDEEAEELLVEAGTAWALAMDSNVIFPETTGELAEDALQSTNMLRRQLGGAAALSQVEGLPTRSVHTIARASFSGMASWYGPGFDGRMSASGERFNQNAMTAAHRTLPFGTLVQVTNLNTGSTAIVRINDRGPYSHGRIIDLSTAAARAIGMIGTGVAPVSIAVLE